MKACVDPPPLRPEARHVGEVRGPPGLHKGPGQAGREMKFFGDTIYEIEHWLPMAKTPRCAGKLTPMWYGSDPRAGPFRERGLQPGKLRVIRYTDRIAGMPGPFAAGDVRWQEQPAEYTG